MRDWLIWTQAIAFIALGGAIWAGFGEHDTIQLACMVLVGVLFPVILIVRSYRHWQHGQRQMIETTAQETTEREHSA